MTATSTLAKSQISTDVTLAKFNSTALGCGAVVTFHGVARPTSKQGEPIDRLVLDWHPTMTEKSIQSIADDGLRRFEVDHVHVTHRCGEITPGDTIVLVAVASRHRRAAFLAADYLMDRLKTDAMFWKREEGAFGHRWIEPTEQDRKDHTRWRN